MKKDKQPDTNQNVSSRTSPLLLRAYKLMRVYAKATSAGVCVHDHAYQPIPEMAEDLLTDKNMCLFCTKYKAKATIHTFLDLTANPCIEMHRNAMKEAHHFGGSYIYMCELGFMFWTSPIYSEGRFIGALVGAGFLGVDSEETCGQMYLLADGEVSVPDLKRKLSIFPRGDPEKIKALAELMFVYAESLSTGSTDYYETIRRRAEQQSILSTKILELKSQYPVGAPGPGYPLDKERNLLAALRRGDNETGKQILNELLAVLLFSNPDQFKYIQYRGIELVVLLSRANVAPGYTEQVLLETNNQYLKRIQDTQSIEELTDVLHGIVEQMAGQIFSFKGIRHAAALRKAEHYIWANYDRKISLQEIADVSGLSAPYFSTIFKQEMGENLSSYLNRLRIEKASRLLVETDRSLSEIAGACGFEDQSWFSKIFKSYTGMSPGKYRGRGGIAVSEISEDNFSEYYRTITKK
jgi:AraC-like DNA-binding protein/ligand-binding sensor protein